MTRHYSAALPILYVGLKIIVVLNWLAGAAALALLVVMPNEQWIMSSFGVGPGPVADRLVTGLRAIAIVYLLMIPINHLILVRLIAIVGTVRAGDPFVRSNAERLQAIGWFLVAVQLLALVIAVIARMTSDPDHVVTVGRELSVGGWFAVLIAFVLARVFAEGSLIREDLEGTI